MNDKINKKYQQFTLIYTVVTWVPKTHTQANIFTSIFMEIHRMVQEIQSSIQLMFSQFYLTNKKQYNESVIQFPSLIYTNKNPAHGACS